MYQFSLTNRSSLEPMVTNLQEVWVITTQFSKEEEEEEEIELRLQYFLAASSG